MTFFRIAVVLVAAAALAAAAFRMDADEPVFTFDQVEAAFDAVGLEVEQPEPASPPGWEVFLEPTEGEDFSIIVLDSAGEAEWMESNTDAIGAKPGSLKRRLGNVWLYRYSGVSAATHKEIERAFSRLSKFPREPRLSCTFLSGVPGPPCPSPFAREGDAPASG